MWRIVSFAGIIFLPVFFGWWLFVPLALLYVYFIKFPYESLLAGAVLDSLYYFGEGPVHKHLLVLYTLVIVVFTLVLSRWVSWRRLL